MNFPSKTSTRGDAALLAEEVDRLLDEHLSHPAEQLAPSSGFVHSVMESVTLRPARLRLSSSPGATFFPPQSPLPALWSRSSFSSFVEGQILSKPSRPRYSRT